MDLKSNVKRFTDPWWKQFEIPICGYRDSSGFVNRLPLRLESEELFIYGTVDAKKMWNNFEDELYTPILVGDKAVVMIWFNSFTDTDCGGAFLETIYNTFVTPKDTPIKIPYKTPFSLLEAAGSQFHQLYT